VDAAAAPRAERVADVVGAVMGWPFDEKSGVPERRPLSRAATSSATRAAHTVYRKRFTELFDVDAELETHSDRGHPETKRSGDRGSGREDQEPPLIRGAPTPPPRAEALICTSFSGFKVTPHRPNVAESQALGNEGLGLPAVGTLEVARPPRRSPAPRAAPKMVTARVRRRVESVNCSRSEQGTDT